MLKIIDATVFPFLAVVSIYLITRFKWKRLIVSFLLIWLSPFFWGVIVLNKFDNERMAMIDHIWLLTGWIVSLFYCFAVYFIGKFLAKLAKDK